MKTKFLSKLFSLFHEWRTDSPLSCDRKLTDFRGIPSSHEWSCDRSRAINKLVRMAVLAQVILLCLGIWGSAVCDTPGNCSYEDIKGTWNFHVGKKVGDRTIDCSEMGAYVVFWTFFSPAHHCSLLTGTATGLDSLVPYNMIYACIYTLAHRGINWSKPCGTSRQVTETASG